MASSARGRALSIVAVLLVLLAVSNFMKPLHMSEDQGFVFFGKRLAGTPNAVAGFVFGVYLLVYAAGIWGMRRFSLPMAWVYAGYVVLNLVLFGFRTPQPVSPTGAQQVFGVVYAIVAIGVSVGTARMLSRRRAELA
jgi:hypothetical protein